MAQKSKKYNYSDMIRLVIIVLAFLGGLVTVIFEFGKTAQNMSLLEVKYKNLETQVIQIEDRAQANALEIRTLNDMTKSHVQKVDDSLTRIQDSVKMSYDRLTRTNARLERVEREARPCRR